jgi:hypothetical protein
LWQPRPPRRAGEAANPASLALQFAFVEGNSRYGGDRFSGVALTGDGRTLPNKLLGEARFRFGWRFGWRLLRLVRCT